MSLFNPSIETQVRPEQPVSFSATGAGLTAIAELGSSLLAGAKPTKPTATEVKSALLTDASNKLAKVQALETKDPKAFRRATSEIYINYIRQGGDPNDLDELMVAQTGRPSEALMFTPEQRTFQEFLGSDEAVQTYYTLAKYQLDRAGTGYTPKDVEAQAFNLYSQDKALTAISATNQLEFDMQEFPAKRAVLLRGVTADVAQYLETPDRFTSNDVETAKARALSQIDLSIANLPPGVEPTKYEELKDQVSQSYDILKTAIQTDLPERLMKDLAVSVEHSVASGDLSHLGALTILNAVRDPEMLQVVISEGGVDPEFYKQIKDTMARVAWNQGDTVGDKDPGPVGNPDNAQQKADEMSVPEAADIVAPTSGHSKMMNRVHKSETAITMWGELALERNAAMIKLGRDGEYWTDRTYVNAFNNTYFKNLEALRGVDEATYGKLKDQTLQAIDESMIVLKNQIDASGLFVVRPDNQVELTDDFMNQIESQLDNAYTLSRFPNIKDRINGVMDIVKEAYGTDRSGRPDLASALADTNHSKLMKLDKPAAAYAANVLRHLRNQVSLFKENDAKAFYNAKEGLDHLARTRSRLTGEVPGGRFGDAVSPALTRETERIGDQPVDTFGLPAPLTSPTPERRPGSFEPVFEGELESTFDQIMEDEGSKKSDEGLHIAYIDSEGNKTIGYGHLWQEGDPETLTESEAQKLFVKDYMEHRNELMEKLPFFDELPDEAKSVFINMAFNLGVDGLLKFKKTLAAAKEGDWLEVAREMRNSDWFTQVDNRSKRLVRRILQLSID